MQATVRRLQQEKEEGELLPAAFDHAPDEAEVRAALFATLAILGLARTDGNDRPIDPVRIVTARPAGAAAGTVATVP